MEIIHSLENFKYKDKKVVVCLGNFDGVHIGHQKIIKAMIDEAKKRKAIPMLVTFDPHPTSIIKGVVSKKIITTLRYKMFLIKNLGVPVCFLIKFDEQFAQMEAQEFFYKVLLDYLHISAIVVGFNFRFGKAHAGNVEFLEKESKKNNIDFIAIEPVKVNGEVVSSSKVRDSIEKADFKNAEMFLGRRYAFGGRVVHGKHVGRTWGFPTANIIITNECIPPLGVYAVSVRVEESLFDGVANIGYTSLKSEEIVLEVYIFNFKEDLYNKDIEIFFVQKIRDEKHFENKEDLIAQIKEDCKQAEKIFSE